MNVPINPFALDDRGLGIRKVAVVSNAASSQLLPRYLPIHPSQDLWHEEYFINLHCLILDGMAIATSEVNPVGSVGLIHKVVFEIYGKIGEHIDHFGYQDSMGDATGACMRYPTFIKYPLATSNGRKCCVISDRHLPKDTIASLVNLPQLDFMTDSVEIFHLNRNYALGCRLYHTPWNLLNPEFHDEEAILRLKAQQKRSGLPTELIDILHLAAAAGIEFIVFQFNAEPLEHLKTYR